ncbi:autotransporter outer membrane beta-barrel domain-containing protein [Acinetobacter sp. 194]|uniref:autotransporter outer membrane beta-barrel domain-containing protein n=1 Tax=Acinetobacter shaoyimingii TaxID=2715164 RepID=UPI001409EEFB|nr:autotransporter outer membrane beta-barrel domain-containing protein [Acinetobacter shaoyimingii]NHB58050.1 autotransporter outer membrane beta-barrel domain-containing protein [Acinetobacter shaoyimingii]
MMKLGNRSLFTTILSSAVFLMNHSYALTIENQPNGNEIGTWGGGIETEIYGQTFKLADSTYNSLNDFTLFLSSDISGNLSFDAYIYKWDITSSKIIGDAIFVNEDINMTVKPGTNPVKVDTGHLKLESNQEYVFFISSLGHPDNAGYSALGGQSIDGYLVYANISEFNELFSSNSWFNGGLDKSTSDFAYILNFSKWLTLQDTMASMQNNILGLNQMFTMQADALENALTQKCSYFNNDNFCVSFTAKYAQANNSSNVDATSGIVNVAYKINPNFYVGGSLEQIVTDINYSGVKYRQKAPDVSAYTGWNHKDNGEGLNFHIAYRHSNGKVDITRNKIDSAEAGNGRSDLTSDAWYASLGNTFNVQDKALVTPYIALRYSDIERKAYTENLSDDVAIPLSYDNLSRKTTTAILGVEAITALTPKINLSGTVGYENDLEKKFSDYSATGIDGLTPLDFNEGYKNNRLFLSTGIDYNFAKNQNIGLNVSYRESAFTPSSVISASIIYQTSF